MTAACTKADLIAQKILLHARRQITKNSPFLLESIYALRNEATDSGASICTDGRKLYYDPLQVIEDFKKDRNSIPRQLLHVTAHCLLGHTQQRGAFPVSEQFDAAADLKAAQFVAMACGPYLAFHPLQRAIFVDLLPALPILYQHIRDVQSIFYFTVAQGAQFDSHELWNSPAENTAGGSSSVEKSAADTASEDGPDWEQLLSDLASGQCGTLPGNLPGVLQEHLQIEERGQSYSSFLRRFAAPEERLLSDPDSFDPRWYHLGLSYYGNIPLLEEAEISEPPVPDKLVIALDTSGSCSGDLCRDFLRETLGILRDISAGAPRFHITLMQCDSAIHREVHLESEQQVEELFDNFTAKGFGGTDFRPVFDRIEELRNDGTLARVRGLLYLTDGYGTFPDTPADYPTVFLIPHKESHDFPPGTEWITQLCFDQDNFTVKEAHHP